MESFYIKGGNTLNGSVNISSAKNALLPILAGSIMCGETVVINKCTRFSDVVYMIKILEELGVKVKFDNDSLVLDCQNANKFFIPDHYTKKVRSSIFMLGPLISRFRCAKVAYPGGCNIGTRPIDLHIKGLKALNVKIEEKHGFIYCDAKNMTSGDVHLDFPSVGATENIMMASVFCKGITRIYNAAKEPEIEDLQNFINATGGKIELNWVIPQHNMALISKIKQTGCKVLLKSDKITLETNHKLKSIPKIETLPYPGFPTDLQSQILTLQTISKGTSIIVENLFETRFKIYTELTKMGANIIIKDRMALVNGVKNLFGANVVAPDLRSGAGLVIAGLCAEGYTTINDVYHIDRGYFNIEEDLRNLGAEIKREGV